MNANLTLRPAFAFLASLLFGLDAPARANAATIEEVAAFPTQQVTGVAVSKDGRVFVNFPYWSKEHSVSVAEVIKDGSLRAYPDEAWNLQEGDPAKRWVCVQSVHICDQGALWVLDPAAPLMEAVVPGGAKLVRIDLANNNPTQTFVLPAQVAPEKSYLNDVRIDNKSGHAYITESGMGALCVVDLKTGKGRRLLADHPSTKAEPDVTIEVDGLKPIDPKTGKTPTFHADGIALDTEQGWLYWHALTGRTLWRAKLADLRDAELPEKELAKRVEKVAETALPDGMLAGRGGTLYLTAIEQNAILLFNANTGKTATVAKDERLQWPDSLAWGPGSWLYVTVSQIHRMPKYHAGKDMREGRPFRVLRMKLDE